ncbi:MAG: helix-turn-helix transcriptional regulator, partial [Pseudonocardia sp.]|nr:helix-turn-helix transcriptional regulator [Pseudonocardia sp.]
LREDAERHAKALNAASGPYPRALAVGAASWLQVEWGEIDTEAVAAAARGLHDLGLRWEGARLAGRAAERVADRRAVVALHACARTLFPTATDGGAGLPGAEEPPDAAAAAAGQAVAPERPTAVPDDPGDGDDVLLSDRELDIGQLILDGLTYKQIGQRLYISGKTVEHHVARMRQRLGVATRNELFSRLRVLLDVPAAP